MKRKIITMSDGGMVSVPQEVSMNIVEIASLFGVFYQTAKSAIRGVEKSGVAHGDYSMSGIVEGLKVYPDYYGLDMIIAVAFRIQSEKAETFRNWIMKKIVRHDITEVFVLPLQKAMQN